MNLISSGVVNVSGGEGTLVLASAATAGGTRALPMNPSAPRLFATPLFPALRSSPSAVQEPPAKSKFLAVIPIINSASPNHLGVILLGAMRGSGDCLRVSCSIASWLRKIGCARDSRVSEVR